MIKKNKKSWFECIPSNQLSPIMQYGTEDDLKEVVILQCESTGQFNQEGNLIMLCEVKFK